MRYKKGGRLSIAYATTVTVHPVVLTRNLINLVQSNQLTHHLTIPMLSSMEILFLSRYTYSIIVHLSMRMPHDVDATSQHAESFFATIHSEIVFIWSTINLVPNCVYTSI